MKHQEYIAHATRHAFNEAFKYAKHVKEDKVNWEPLDCGRSVLNICQELTKCPDWGLDLLKTGKLGEHTEEMMEEYKKETASWTSVETCHKVGHEKLEAYLKAVVEFPDDRMGEKIWLPFDGGRDFTMPEIMSYPLWNFTYHQGQIAYVETLYGDKDMP